MSRDAIEYFFRIDRVKLRLQMSYFEAELIVQFQSPRISGWLGRSNPSVFAVWCIIAAFTTYFSMYAFRKPFTVAQYENLAFWGIHYKVILLFAQVGGYAISKFIGIKVISEMTPSRRATTIVGLVAIAHFALLPYAVAPYWLKPFFLFLNGLPLGMVFGCVFAFLEGRRVTEALAAGLCASFIMASGVVKSVGAVLMTSYGVSQFWMPLATGALFWPTLLIGVWMLNQIPLPDQTDVAYRSDRTPINGQQRRRFFGRYAIGLSALILLVIMLTLFRSVRDDYAAEIWRGFGFEKPEVFAQSETMVAIIAVALSAATVFIRGNHLAFRISMAIVGLGFACAFGTVLTYWGTQSWTEQSAFQFMVIIGVSLYVPYVLFHTTIFERLIAVLRDKSNVGFLLYLADSAGYMSTVVLMVIVNLVVGSEIDFVGLLFWIAVIISPLSILGTLLIVAYFQKKDGDPAHVTPGPLSDYPNQPVQTSEPLSH